MRALHLIKTGHGASWALRQIDVLLRQGIEIHVALGEDGPMRQRYEAAGAIVHLIPVDIARIRVGELRTAARRLRDLVSDVKPDLVHSHFVGSTLFMRLALRSNKSMPRLFQVPGPLHLESILPRRIELASATTSDYWIATCQLTKNIYQRLGVPTNRLFLSYYGTTLGHLRRPGLREETRGKLGIPPDALAVGLVAFMYPPRRWLGQKTGLKGHEDLLDALHILRADGRNVVGVFAGGAWGAGDWYEARVRQYGAERLGKHALFLGTRNDIPAIYEAIDIAAHPSHSENVGGAVESLLLTVPTVASAVGGFPDVIMEGETGLLVPPKNPRALATAIARMMDAPEEAQAMAKKGERLCENLFDVERTGREIAEIYRAIVQAHHAARR